MVLRSARPHLSVKKVMAVATWNSTQDDSVRYSPYTMPAQRTAHAQCLLMRSLSQAGLVAMLAVATGDSISGSGS